MLFQRFSDVFGGNRKRSAVLNGLILTCQSGIKKQPPEVFFESRRS